VRPLVEERIDAVVRYEVLASTSGAVSRFAVVNGQRLRAHVYGRRESMQSRELLPLHGVALDGELAVLDAPLRALDAFERVSKPTTREGDCNDPLWFDAGDAVNGYCSAEDAAAAGDALENHLLMASGSWSTGAKKLIYIKVNFTDAPSDPISTSAAQGAMTTVDNYFRAASYNKTSIATTVAGPYMMPMTKAAYQSAQAETQLMNDAL